MRPVKIYGENFEELAISYMNNVNDEKDLIADFDELDEKEYGQQILNNGFRIAPYLMCGQYDNAQKVISEILQQHNAALISNKNGFIWSDELFNEKKQSRLLRMQSFIDYQHLLILVTVQLLRISLKKIMPRI